MGDKVLLPIWPDTGQALGGIGRTKVFELIKNGELRAVKIGRRTFVVAESVSDFIRRLEQQPSQTTCGLTGVTTDIDEAGRHQRPAAAATTSERQPRHDNHTTVR